MPFLVAVTGRKNRRWRPLLGDTVQVKVIFLCGKSKVDGNDLHNVRTLNDHKVSVCPVWTVTSPVWIVEPITVCPCV
jgi:hypothetical protein